MKKPESVPVESNKAWHFAIVAYIIFDYARPQSSIPGLGAIRPALIIDVLLFLFLMANGCFSKSFPRQLKLMWYFVLLLGAYIPFAINNYYAFDATFSQLLYMPFIMSIIFCIDSFDRFKNFIFLLIIIMVYISIFSLFHAGRGPGNYFQDENDLSLYVNTWLPFCYFLFFAERDFRRRFIYIVGMIVGIASIVISFSRGGFVGLLAIVSMTILFSKKKVITVMMISTASVVFLLCVDQSYMKEMDTVTDPHESTAAQRIGQWQSAWYMFLDNPLGVGGKNFPVRVPEYQQNRFDHVEHGMWGRAAHSIWFTVIPELGIAGIFLYLALIYANLKDSIWLKRLHTGEGDSSKQNLYFHFLGLAFLTSLVGFFVSGTFISVLYYSHYWYLTGLIACAVKVAKLAHEETS